MRIAAWAGLVVVGAVCSVIGYVADALAHLCDTDIDCAHGRTEFVVLALFGIFLIIAGCAGIVFELTRKRRRQ